MAAPHGSSYCRTEAGDALAAQLDGDCLIEPGFAIPDLESPTA